MMTSRLARGGIVVGAALAGLAATSACAQDPLARLVWKSRVLVVLAPDPADARLAMQRAVIAAVKTGFEERDLVVVESVGPARAAEGLRRRFDVPASAFRVILLGKDGGVKLSSSDAIPAERLFATIDAMPMRQREMQDR